MNCPTENVSLSMRDRHGVGVGPYPRCRGGWLDRGEIDKGVEREVAADGPIRRRDVAPGTHEPPFYRDDRPARRAGYRAEPYPRERDEYPRDDNR